MPKVETNADGLDVGSGKISQVGDAAGSLVDEFRTAMAPYSDWMGTNDSFAKSAMPQFQKSMAYAVDVLGAIASAVQEIAGGSSRNAAGLRTAQEDAVGVVNSAAAQQNQKA